MGETAAETSTLLVDGPDPSDGTRAIEDALKIIDHALSTLLQRELVSADEVTDVLLDVRTVLSAPTV